jgi:hypothetical protein
MLEHGGNLRDAMRVMAAHGLDRPVGRPEPALVSGAPAVRQCVAPAAGTRSATGVARRVQPTMARRTCWRWRERRRRSRHCRDCGRRARGHRSALVCGARASLGAARPHRHEVAIRIWPQPSTAATCWSCAIRTTRPAPPSRAKSCWLGGELAARGGWLVVDEAFADTDAPQRGQCGPARPDRAALGRQVLRSGRRAPRLRRSASRRAGAAG